MRKLVSVVILVGCMAYLAGCGGGSSTTNAVVTNIDTLTAPIVTLPVAYPANLGGAYQKGSALTFHNYSVSTLTGSRAGFGNHSTSVSPPAKFNRPLAITSDGTNLYVADYLNNVIRKIEIASGLDRTIATVDATTKVAVSFNFPRDITTDGTNIYVADSGNYTIRKIVVSTNAVTGVVTGEVTTLAGGAGIAGSVDDADGAKARFNIINGITTDGFSLYVTDSNNTIRRIGLTGLFPVTTLAGSPGTIGSTDGKQGAARFYLPNRITTDGPNLYVTDFNNSTIRKIALATGEVTTIAGKVGPGGFDGTHADSTDGTGKTARFNQPNGITTDGVNLYVTDSYDNTIRMIVLSPATVYSGPVTTIAGAASGIAGGSKEGIGTVATFYNPIGITTDGSSLYIVDSLNHGIRKIQ